MSEVSKVKRPIRDVVKGAADVGKLTKVSVPEWDCDVWVRTISGAERDSFEAACFVERKRGRKRSRELSLVNFRARLTVLCACEEDGKPAFMPGDVDWLGAKSGVALNRVFEVAQRVNGFTEEDVEELAGN